MAEKFDDVEDVELPPELICPKDVVLSPEEVEVAAMIEKLKEMKPGFNLFDSSNLKELPAGTNLEDMKAMLQQQLAGMGTEKDNENVTPKSEDAFLAETKICTKEKMAEKFDDVEDVELPPELICPKDVVLSPEEVEVAAMIEKLKEKKPGFNLFDSSNLKELPAGLILKT